MHSKNGPAADEQLLGESTKAGVKISEQFRHLLFGKPPRKARHQSLAGEHHATHLGVRRRRAARQGRPHEDCMKIGRNFFEREVIVLMAMRTADGIEMLALSLVRR